VPLLLATPDSFMLRDGLLQAPIPLSQTVFTPWNLGLVAVVVLALTAFVALLHPAPERVVRADPAALAEMGDFAPPPRPAHPTPAERVMHARLPTLAIGAMGLSYVAQQAASGQFALTLDSVNLTVLSLALALHPNAASIGRAAEEAARPLHGVVLQFPLYAGLYGIIKDTGLATALADLFLRVATERTFPFVVFVYSALLDYFVPSGGAKWATEAAYVLQAGQRLGVPVTDIAMAYAYGDMATNLVQPFWAIPLLAVARLEFRDVLGFLILVFLAYCALVGAALFL
jgi:short-chain fatty acids transporter